MKSRRTFLTAFSALLGALGLGRAELANAPRLRVKQMRVPEASAVIVWDTAHPMASGDAWVRKMAGL